MLDRWVSGLNPGHQKTYKMLSKLSSYDLETNWNGTDCSFCASLHAGMASTLLSLTISCSLSLSPSLSPPSLSCSSSLSLSLSHSAASCRSVYYYQWLKSNSQRVFEISWRNQKKIIFLLTELLIFYKWSFVTEQWILLLSRFFCCYSLQWWQSNNKIIWTQLKGKTNCL